MGKIFITLLKKDLRMMMSGKFFLITIGSLALYSCYIHFVYVKIDQPVYPVYLYDPGYVQNNASSLVIRVNSIEALAAACEDGYAIGVDLSGGLPAISMISSGTDTLDNYRAAYAISELDAGNVPPSQIIGANDKEMKNRREITVECLFFELTAVGFLGLAAIVFKEKQMGVIWVHSILPFHRNAFILSKLGLFFLADMVFTILLTFLNIGIPASLDILPAVLLNAGILSLIMALTGFYCAVTLTDFKQFSLLYLVLAVFITTPVFLVGQTGIALDWINYHPMYHLFMTMKNAFFMETSGNGPYYLVCVMVIILLFLAVRRGLDREMAKEG